MRFSLTPKENVYFTMLSDCASHLVSGSAVLAELVAADRPARTELAERLHEIEHQADLSTHDFIKKINSSFVTPLDRDDLLLLATGIDDCVDYMDEAGDFIVLYKVGELPEGAIRLVSILQRCSEITFNVMPRLRSMDHLRDYWVEINRLENEADRIHRQALADLFDSELGGKTVIKLKDIILTLERAVDSFERLANSIETIAVKES